MAPPRSTPELMEDLVEEVLLRLPPDEPACLVRASLVCKPWRRLLSGRAFLRRYRAFHGAPPLVGFLLNRDPLDSCRFPSFVPTASIPSLAHPAAAAADWSIAWAIDCRHGRVLLQTWGTSERLVVWYPTTGDWRVLPRHVLRRCALRRRWLRPHGLQRRALPGGPRGLQHFGPGHMGVLVLVGDERVEHAGFGGYYQVLLC
ncbi:hypothetical protein PR202_gb12114 [Eleusine coracana subsp. coracana]|uniref:F-box domain-containing protein n=1 Tax=Eleusine coracana subsp. coracana TaxID=191504 RepID=A0AAV5EQK6_ELECO|nr:hypothetical protein PR202_gb12114 [Eleusine coracana subsp. coracana]